MKEIDARSQRGPVAKQKRLINDGRFVFREGVLFVSVSSCGGLSLVMGPVRTANCSVPGYNVASMIAHLRGKLLTKHPNQAIVETAGVGYDVTISVPTFSDLPSVGSEVALHIHTHVREDLIALYGFLRPGEKQLFEN